MAIIVLGLIDSPAGTAAARTAVKEARRRALDVLVVHVETREEHLHADEEDAFLGQLEAVKQVLVNEGLEFRVVRTAYGANPANELVELGRREKAELVIIGLRRRSAVGKALLGSQAHDILMDAPCPVLTVRTDSVP